MRIRDCVAGAALLSLLIPAAATAQATTERLSLTYEGAQRAAQAAEDEARANQWNVTIVVVDDAGVPLYVKRMDGASRPTYEIALGKARTSASFGRPSLAFQERAEEGGVSLPGILPLEGGVPIVVDGEVVGAIAASGVQSDQDAQIARAGAEAVADGL